MSPQKSYNPLPGTRHDPTRHERDEVLILNRDDGLGDVPPHALNQLTALLSMELSVNVSKPNQEWLDKQDARAANLDKSVLRPSKVLERVALKVNGVHRLPFMPQMAKLCSAHKALDPRVIRNLTLLIGKECTLRTDRFRSYRTRTQLPDDVASWLDRIDSVTAMWVGPHAFAKVFGYDAAMPAIAKVESGCEACIMAVVGGRPQLLCDLRASCLMRKMREHGKEPRLLRILDSWLSHFNDRARYAAKGQSEAIAASLKDVFDEMRRRKEKRAQERAAAGKPPKKRHHKRRTPKLPELEQPQARYPRSDGVSLKYYDADSPASSHPLTMGNEDAARAWIEDHMQHLTPEEQEAVRSDIHPVFRPVIDPALSEFKAPSAVPSPLSVQRNRYDVAVELEEQRMIGSRGTTSSNDTAWTSCTVQDSWLDPPSPRHPFGIDSGSDSGSSGSEYIPPRAAWRSRFAPETDATTPTTPKPNPLASPNPFEAVSSLKPASPPRNYPAHPPPPAASSFYSEHPGFPVNHNVEVTRPVLQNPFLSEERQRKLAGQSQPVPATPQNLFISEAERRGKKPPGPLPSDAGTTFFS